MKITCREARTDDLAILNQFQRGIIDAEAKYIPRRRNEAYYYYDLSELMKASDVRIAVAEFDGQLISSGYAKKVASKTYLEHAFHAYVGFMYTRPEYRGQGVARQVLNYLGDWATSQGIDELRLDVFAGNTQAIRAYEKAGFEPNLLEMRLQLHAD